MAYPIPPGANMYPVRAPARPAPPAPPRPAVPAMNFGTYLSGLTSGPGLAQIKALLAGLGLGGPSTPYVPQTSDQLSAQARALIQAQIGPIIDQINASIASRSQQGSAAIQSYTGQLAGLEGQYAPTMGAAYDKAQTDLHALETGLANRLGGAGKSGAKEVVGALAQAGQDTSGAQGLAGIGKRAGNASAAKGGASEAALIASRAADQVYGAKLPGIVGLIGAQQGRDYQTQLNTELGSLLGGVQSQVPGLVASTLQNLQAQELSKQQDYTSQKQTAGSNVLNLWQSLMGGFQSKQAADAANKVNLAKIAEADKLAGVSATQKAKAAQDKSTLAWRTLQERIAHDKATEANAKATTEQRAAAARDRVAAQAQAQQVSQSKAAQVAQQKAAATAVRMAAAAAKKTTTYTVQPVRDPLTGQTVNKRVPVSTGATAAYYKAIHQIEAAVSATLSPYMNQSDIIRFVQQIVNQYYSPGAGGRPADVPVTKPSTHSVVGTGPGGSTTLP